MMLRHLELLVFLQQSVVLLGEALHLLLRHVVFRLGALQRWGGDKSKSSLPSLAAGIETL